MSTNDTENPRHPSAGRTDYIQFAARQEFRLRRPRRGNRSDVRVGAIASCRRRRTELALQSRPAPDVITARQPTRGQRSIVSQSRQAAGWSVAAASSPVGLCRSRAGGSAGRRRPNGLTSPGEVTAQAKIVTAVLTTVRAARRRQNRRSGT